MSAKLTFLLILFSLTCKVQGQKKDSVSHYSAIVKSHIYKDYKKMYRQGGGALVYPFLTPGSNQYANVLWDWDSWLSNVALRQILSDIGSAEDKEEAIRYEQGCVLNFLHYGNYTGYLPISIYENSDPKKNRPENIYDVNMHKPVLAQHAAFITQQTGGNADWIREHFYHLQAFVNNYKSHHRHQATGLYYWQTDVAIGVDNDPATFFRPYKSSGSIYLNCLMYKELLAMVYLADRLKLAEIGKEFAADAAALKAAVQEHCWDERDGFFYSVDLNLRPVTNRKDSTLGRTFLIHSGYPRDYDCLIQRIEVWSCFLPLWAGIATPEQAERMVKEHYANPKTFNSPSGVRSLSKMEKMYSLRTSANPSNWRGPIWGISNYMVFRGMADYGFSREAKELATKTLLLFGKDFEKNGALHEYYEPESGEPMLNKGFQNWNYLVLNMVAWLEGKEVVREFSNQSSQESLSPVRLRCEYLSHPQGIERTRPRLSWELEGSARNLYQSAYQILVASTSDLLDADKGDLWDSQKVLSDETAHIAYAGSELTSAQQVFWKLRVWNQHGNISAWSKPASWTMGLLKEKVWGGKWIGLEGKIAPAYLRDANWICFPADRKSPPQEAVERYYRRIVTIPVGKEVKQAELLYTGDYACNGGMNGALFGTRNNHHRIKNPSIAFRLREGENVITLTGTTPGKTVASGGVVAAVEITFMDGDKIRIPTDEKWKVSDVAVAGWDQPGFDDAAWLSALNLGPVGAEPWGEVLIAEDRRLPARYLRKEFETKRNIRRATVFYAGLGWSELYINGEKIGDEVLSPGLSEYPKRIFYVTADVTKQLRSGKNAIGIILGNGRFFAPRSETYASMPSLGFPKLRLHLRIAYDDGSVAEILSDESWKLTDKGPIISNNDYDGEEYDARKELGNWASAGYDDAAWQQAEAAIVPEGKLQAQMIAPIRITESLKPIAVTEPEPGRFIFDLGQNIVGWCRLKVTGDAGTVVTLRHAETLLPNGKLSLVNMRAAMVTDVYTLKGKGEELWEPRFTTHGFRYVEVRGYPGKPDLDAIEGRMVHDDLPVTGSFSSANPLLNQIYQNANWGVRGNYKSIPMDCPQRDERQGWLGDRIEEMRGEAYMFDVAPLYTKWLQDIRDVQDEQGSIPSIAPNYWSGKGDNVTWPSASVIIPQTLWEQYADKQVIADNYQSSKKWMTRMSKYVIDGITESDKYGDWCVPPEDLTLIHTHDPSRITSKGVLATSFFYHDARLMEKYAGMLGFSADSMHYAALADSLKSAFNRKYYDPSLAQYDNGTQTSYILPLAFGMVPASERARVFENLAKNIVEKSNSHVGLGLIGGQYLYRVLSDNGRADLAYTIATQSDYPGYGYMISQGATTIWELWNGDTADPSMNSGNHVMLLGDFVPWLYGYLAGIMPDADQPGFKHIIMKPQVPGNLAFVKASYHSLRGEISSEWHDDARQFEWQISIPPNTSATIYLPASHAELIEENGKPIAEVKELTYQGREKNYLVYTIQNGSYHFTVRK